MRSTTSLSKFDDAELTMLFATVGAADQGELIKDCGTYEKAIMYRQMAYMWRTAAEKDYNQRLKDYQNLLSRPESEIPKYARLGGDDPLKDVVTNVAERLTSRRKMLDLAQKVMIKNKPPKSQYLVFCCSKFQFNTSISEIRDFANKHKDLIDKDSEVYKLLFPSFDD